METRGETDGDYLTEAFCIDLKFGYRQSYIVAFAHKADDGEHCRDCLGNYGLIGAD